MLLNYLKNMWNGNIRLVILFWVYYTIISSILNELFFSKLDEYNNWPFIIILIFYICTVFLWISPYGVHAINIQEKKYGLLLQESL